MAKFVAFDEIKRDEGGRFAKIQSDHRHWEGDHEIERERAKNRGDHIMASNHLDAALAHNVVARGKITPAHIKKAHEESYSAYMSSGNKTKANEHLALAKAAK